MGIDWFRFKLKDNTDISLVKRLIEQQAIRCQSLWGLGSNFDVDLNHYSILERIHLQPYINTSRKLKEILEFPEWNEEKGCAKDIPELDPGIRVYVITWNRCFPPLWRVLAHRTYLPEELKEQLKKWQQWIFEVKQGQHDEYLKELHLHETLNTLTKHLSCLRGSAIASLTKTNNWTKKTNLIATRQKILELPESSFIEIRLDPNDPIDKREDNFEDLYRETFDYLKEVIQLTRSWDSNVRGNWKVNYYESRYYWTLQDFKEVYLEDDEAEWLNKFFTWVEQCIEHNFGLFFDY